MSQWENALAVLNSGFEFRKRLGADAVGLKVIDYLTQCYSGFTQDEWLRRIESGRVLLDGIPSNPDEILHPGRILSWMRPPWEEPEAPVSFAILFRDEHLLGVAKPAGLPTVPGGGRFMENTLLYLVRRHFPAANPLHRLGRGTSGIVLFALKPEAASGVARAWRCGRILKIYRALASGCPAKDEFDIDAPIGPVPHKILKTIHAACPNGKAAHSHVRVLERHMDCSLVEIRITTGRPHQIRIHLAAAGHPLVGDPLYVIGGIPAENSLALPGDLGYGLHNAVLGFDHPVTARWTEIACMPPFLLRLKDEAKPEFIQQSISVGDE
jgi:23S rRNA pseudouridine1911/1915/1917 synthase